MYGIGREKDRYWGASWFQKAADQGHTAAQFHLSYSYFNGAGVLTDSVAGYKWLYLASTRDPKNQEYRTRLSEVDARVRGDLVARGKALALEWLKKWG
jgi:TPR repeat protein